MFGVPLELVAYVVIALIVAPIGLYILVRAATLAVMRTIDEYKKRKEGGL